MRGAAATLDRLRALRAAHHRERLGWPEEAPDPEPDAEDEIEGLTCAWSPPSPQPGRQHDTRTKPRRPTFDEARLPEELIAKLRFVDYRKRRIWLQDGSSVEDQEIRLILMEGVQQVLALVEQGQAPAAGLQPSFDQAAEVAVVLQPPDLSAAACTGQFPDQWRTESAFGCRW